MTVSNPLANTIVLVGRLLLVTLFVVSGWGKITNFAATAHYMAQSGLPMPELAATVSIAAELLLGLLVAFGVFVRPLALVMAAFTLATALIGHAFWSMEGAARYGASVQFYKNLSIIGGFLLLYVTGPGRYSVDALRQRAPTAP